MPVLNQQIKLPNGRVLGYDEYGPSDGTPIIHFHGSPSSRVEWSLFGNETMAQALHLRVIVPDRPGLGLADFQADRRIIDWHKDVVALADHLRLNRFAIMGYSGGGPYAIACALSIPERLTKVGIVSGTGPFDERGLADDIDPDNLRFLNLARNKPRRARLMLAMMKLTAKWAGDKMIANAVAALPEPDRQIMTQPEMQKGFLRMVQEALRQGTRRGQSMTRI